MTESQQSETGLNGMIAPEADSNEFVEAVELLHGDAGDVTAETVNIEQSSAGSISAERVTVTKSMVRRLDAGSAQLSQTATLILKSDDTALSESAAWIISHRAGRSILWPSKLFQPPPRVTTDPGRSAGEPTAWISVHSALT